LEIVHRRTLGLKLSAQLARVRAAKIQYGVTLDRNDGANYEIPKSASHDARRAVAKGCSAARKVCVTIYRMLHISCAWEIANELGFAAAAAVADPRGP
jgi:hypothetical protein